MRWAWLIVLVIACAPARPAETPTDDPRLAEAQRVNAQLQAERDALAAQVRDLNAQLASAKGPLSMWSAATSIGGGMATDVVLPDTFTVHIVYTASTPVRARIMELSEYWKYRSGRPFDALVYPASTSFDLVFHDAEGCGAYVLVLDAAQGAYLTPDITVTYAPASQPTGVCAR